METANWPPEHSAALRDLRARGMSYADITRTINARFKTSYSRNATLGRAQRLGLGTPVEGGPPRRERIPELLEVQSGPNRQPEVGAAARANLFSCPEAARFKQENASAALRRDHAAPLRGDRARSRQLPVSVWRRRRRRADHLLRPSPATGLELLHPAFSSQQGSRGPAAARPDRRLA